MTSWYEPDNKSESHGAVILYFAFIGIAVHFLGAYFLLDWLLREMAARVA